MSRPSFVNEAQWRQLLANGERANRDDAVDPVPVVLLRTPDGATWLLSEVEPEEPDRAFGLCDLGLGYPELGYVSLGELAAVLGAAIEADIRFIAQHPLSAYADAARLAGQIVPFAPPDGPTDIFDPAVPFTPGQRIYWWSGRGSEGFGVIRELRDERALIDPEPGAIRGSDYRRYAAGSTKADFFGPRDFGLRVVPRGVV